MYFSRRTVNSSNNVVNGSENKEVLENKSSSKKMNNDKTVEIDKNSDFNKKITNKELALQKWIEKINSVDILKTDFNELSDVIACSYGLEDMLTGTSKVKYNQILVKYEMLQKANNCEKVNSNGRVAVEDNSVEDVGKKGSLNVKNYARVSFPAVSKDCNLTFNQAMSIVRDTKLSYYEKHDAIAKIIVTLRNRKLNNFNKYENEMTYICQKINANKADDKDLNRLAELIYHFSLNGDMFEEYIYDEYDRFVKDKGEKREQEP